MRRSSAGCAISSSRASCRPARGSPSGCSARSFGISRTPLREAFKVLASEGLVELLPNRGARVAPLDEADIENMFEVMAALEALAGSLACARIAEAELAEIAALHYEMLAQYTRRNLPDYFRLNQAIHAAIVAASRQPGSRRDVSGLGLPHSPRPLFRQPLGRALAPGGRRARGDPRGAPGARRRNARPAARGASAEQERGLARRGGDDIVGSETHRRFKQSSFRRKPESMIPTARCRGDGPRPSPG